MTTQPWRKVLVNERNLPMVWKLRLECGHYVYKAGSIVEDRLPKKVRCLQCKPEEKL